MHVLRYAKTPVEVNKILDAIEKAQATFVAVSKTEPKPEGYVSDAREAEFVVWFRVTDEDHMVRVDAVRLGYV
jgi:hypothetical protein